MRCGPDSSTGANAVRIGRQIRPDRSAEHFAIARLTDASVRSGSPFESQTVTDLAADHL